MDISPAWSPLSVVIDRRAYTVYSILRPKVGGDFHFMVEWDEDRDQRVLGAVLALYYRHPNLFENVLVWSESKAHLVVSVRPRVINRSENSRDVMSSAQIEVERALSEIATDDWYPVGDHWAVTVERIDFPLPADHPLAGIDRLHKLGAAG
jgi:hypothetical protein